MIKIGTNDLLNRYVGTTPVAKVFKGHNLIWESSDWYGIRWKDGDSNCVRIGKLSYHTTLPLQNQMRRCMINKNTGDIRYISDEDPFEYTNGTSVDYGDNTYQFCVEIPSYKFEAYDEVINNETWHVLKVWPTINYGINSPKCYIGVTELLVNSNSNDVATAISQTFLDFAAMNVDKNTTSINAADVKYILAANTYRNYSYSNTSTTDVKSSLGRPRTNLNRSIFRDIARRTEVEGFDVSQQSWQAYNSLLRLYLLEYANCDSQASFNPNLTVEGYHQGGLGPGVTTLTSSEWSAFNAYNPFIPAGITVPLGNKSGYINYVFAAGEFKEEAITFQVNSYRGVELPFGHIGKFIDGFNRRGALDAEQNAIEEIYVCNNPSKFIESDNITPAPEGYTLISATTPSNSGNKFTPEWINKGTFWPKPANTNTFKDYFYNAYANDIWYGLRVGPMASYGDGSGLFYFYAGSTANYVYAHTGSRLMLTEK